MNRSSWYDSTIFYKPYDSPLLIIDWFELDGFIMDELVQYTRQQNIRIIINVE